MRYWLLLASLWLSGCAQMGGSQQPEHVPALLAPELLGVDVQVSQRLAFTRDGRAQSLLIVWSQQAGKLQLVGLTPQGQTVFSVGYDGRQLDQQARVPLPPGLSARRLLQELQWAYWPREAIVRELATSGWSFAQTAGQRLVTGPHGEQLSYTFSGGEFPASLQLEHSQGYRLHIDTLSIEHLPAGSQGD
jgi:hypothetical protein